MSKILRMEFCSSEEYETPRFRAVVYDADLGAKRPPICWVAESEKLSHCVNAAKRMFPDLILHDADGNVLQYGKTNIVKVIERNYDFK